MNQSSRIHRLGGAVAAFAIVVAACGGTGAEETTTTTTALVATSAVTTTVTAAPDTTPPTTAPPEPTTTTTTEAPPATNGVIVGFEGVLGWWDGTDWQTLDDGEPPAGDGDAYQVLQIGEPTTTVLGGPLMAGCEFIEGSRTIDLGFDVDTWPSSTPIAVSTVEELTPHSVELLSTPPAIYTSIISDLLATRGVVDPAPPIVQVIRTDLEGDGVDEVLIAAERNETGSLNPAATDDYSILVLRKIVQGDVQTAVIASYIVEPPVVEGSIVALDTFRFTSVADFNADGKMEIAYTSQYYEGSSTHLVEYLNDDLGPVEVLAVGCGV